MSHRELLELQLQKFRIELTSAQKHALADYCDELVRWNRSINLTALSGPDLLTRLVLEPVWVAQQLALTGRLVDIGSGNGSPAIPFRIAGALRQCHLIEARTRRAAFLRHLVSRLHLENVAVHRARFEDIAGSLPSADWISVQAVALTEKLLASMRAIAAPTTMVVWLTSRGSACGLQPVRRLVTPCTGSEALIYRLDLS